MAGGTIALRAALCVALALPLAAAARLPPDVEQALKQVQVPPQAMAVVVQEVGSSRDRLAQQSELPVNPGSLFKLVTTYAALDLLGPTWTWMTPVWLTGTLSADGVLDGSLVIQGSGDPTLVLERVWLLLRRVRALGVREIRGDIVLDRSAFAPVAGSAGDFDNEPLRPYNVQPDALLLNHKAVQYAFVPDPARGVAKVIAEPALAGVQVDASVPLSAAPCGDWRAALKATYEPSTVRFAGSYPAACGEARWPVAYVDPAHYNARLVEALWRELGGSLAGEVRDGAAPIGRAPNFEWTSPPLAEIVRDINKFSNNVMAQQLFLTLALQWHGLGDAHGARERLQQWWSERLGEPPSDLVIDNGSGLSRATRVTARALAKLLQSAWAAPVMPEFVASLPLVGLDGTLKRSRASIGRAHLKTGSLRDVAAIAGYVLAQSGRRYVLVAIVQHPNAGAARAALDALVQWTIDDAR